MSIIKDKIYSEIIYPGSSTNKNEANYLHNRHLDKKQFGICVVIKK
ncbi:uncharacterized protein METZ01_LOCUS408420 [marine metagenome]|uniref:Uncharacterized protein n=1 Tax=marine metagenome TaxID=408172 RepID=A0A382W9L8_9ZZZZ